MGDGGGGLRAPILNMLNGDGQELLLTLKFSPSKSISTYLLLAISLQNRLFCWENVGIDHTLTSYPIEKQFF